MGMTKAQKNTDDNQMNFSADVSRLLDIVANALYSNRDVFLRELISNAADACDRLRYESIQKPELTQDNADFRIHIYKNTKTRTLTIVDNGTGMSRAELIDHLGTIAKSGTAKLMEKMKDSGDPLKLIGQFGVGFYASFMVADTVSVTSIKAGSKTANTWISDGRTGFTIEKATQGETAKLDGARGTAITLHLKDDASEFLLDEKLKQTIAQYSDHIDVKIFLNTPAETATGEGQPANAASAIWKRQKSDVTKEQYGEFYRSITGGFDEPILTSHWHAEGAFAYSALLFIPMMRPWDLYDPSRKGSVKLYVRRVFISDNMPDLMCPWLRFVRGVIDSEDLPLNISRENLQHNPILYKIRTGVTTRILKDLAKLADNDDPGFITFWGQFGSALKEGLYDAHTHREDIFKICRFFSTHDNGEQFTSLEDYISRMKDDQKDIYYISGESLESLKNSPQIEGFKSRGLEVLFMTDTIDEFWLQQVPDFQGKNFKSVTKGDINFADQKNTDENTPETTETTENLVKTLKEILQGEVSDVRISKRLTDSPVCLVAGDNAPDMHMERVLKIQQNYKPTSKPILEINTGHSLIKKLENLPQDKIEDAAYLLLDQALIIQGEPLPNPAEFARRMSAILEKAL
jgi:molecular chaperone HtpG